MRPIHRLVCTLAFIPLSCGLTGNDPTGPVRVTTTPLARDGEWLERHERQMAFAAEGGWELLFVGDSITEGWETTGAGTWDAFYAGRRALNLGISGDRTQHVLWRFAEGVLEGLDPELAVVMIGTNNSGDDSSREIADGVAAVVGELRARLPGTRVLLLAIFPRGAEPMDEQRQVNEAANALIRRLADGEHVRWLDIGDEFLEADGTLPTDIMPDLLHLTEEGYRRWAEAIEEEVAAVLGSRAMVGSDQPVSVVEWGTHEGQPVHLYTLRNEAGWTLSVTDYGATITALTVPDRAGELADVVLGYDDLPSYVEGSSYFGCIVGRCANRIAGGRFSLGGRRHELARNDGDHHLHGGRVGFDRHVWSATVIEHADGPSLRLDRVSADGEEGYPGVLHASVTYTLTHGGELRTEMSATTTASTPCNLAQHTYWNLSGHASGSIRDHEVRFHAERYLPVDEGLIPTGELADVAGTPFDFREPKPIGRDLDAVGAAPVGYDHNLIVDGTDGELRPVCRVVDPASGRCMELWSDQPGVQFYTGNFLDGTEVGKGGAAYEQHQAFCLETQCWPDAIHHEGWPDVVLEPGEAYRHVMVTRFTTE